MKVEESRGPAAGKTVVRVKETDMTGVCEVHIESSTSEHLCNE